MASGLDIFGDTRAALPQPKRAARIVGLSPEVQGIVPLAAAVVAGAAGFALFRKTHPVLGLLGGIAAGTEAGRLATGRKVSPALARLGTATASIGGALLWKNHPVLGFLGGGIVGGLGITAAFTAAGLETVEK